MSPQREAAKVLIQLLLNFRHKLFSNTNNKCKCYFPSACCRIAHHDAWIQIWPGDGWIWL